MNYSSIFNKDLPELCINKKELTDLVCDALPTKSNSFDFVNLLTAIARQCIANKTKFNLENNVEYNEVLDGTDKVRIREIIWDLIILRYLTLGDYYHDTWPHLSVTESGIAFLVGRIS